MRTRLAAALVVLLAGAVGCDRGGDGDAAGPTTTTTAGGTTTSTAGGTSTTTAVAAGEGTATTAPAPKTPADLQDAVLRPSDFPPGWTSEPADDADDDETDAAMERCLDLERGGAERPEAASPDFSVGDVITRASSSVERAPDLATVDREYAAVASPRFLDCAAQQFDAAVAREAAGAQFAPARAERVPFPNLGDGTAAVRLTTTLSAGAEQVPFAADLVFVRKGLFEMSFTFVNAGGPFDPALAADLVTKVVARA